MSADRPITVWILGDQLLLDHPALRNASERRDGALVHVLLVESQERIQRLPYQRKKVVLLLSAMRHYANRLREMGHTVDYVTAPTMLAGLRQHVARHRPAELVTMAAAEYRGRIFQEQRLATLLNLRVTVLPNTQFLLGRYNPMRAAAKTRSDKPPIMETFYRRMRRHFDILMQGNGEPVGGSWNFDKQNRKPLPKAGLAAAPPVLFKPDIITTEVMAEVGAYDAGFGSVDDFGLAVTHEEAEIAADDFFSQRLPDFGSYEDAMSAEDSILYHSKLAVYLNIGLLDPLDLVERAQQAYRNGAAPINSVEGFVRQILGWREYIYMHYWLQMPALLTANGWGHLRPLPQMFWDGETDMHCIRTVVHRVVEAGYSHHIERLMVLCNFCMLAGIDPAEVNRWFLTAYVDAFEWVVAPNVIGMGLNADGGQTATKPYISSANYIHKMGNFCSDCRFDPKQRVGEDACPFNFLYWHFLIENEERLRANPRLGPAVLGLRHLDEAERRAVQSQAQAFLSSGFSSTTACD